MTSPGSALAGRELEPLAAAQRGRSRGLVDMLLSVCSVLVRWKTVPTSIAKIEKSVKSVYCQYSSSSQSTDVNTWNIAIGESSWSRYRSRNLGVAMLRVLGPYLRARAGKRERREDWRRRGTKGLSFHPREAARRSRRARARGGPNVLLALRGEVALAVVAAAEPRRLGV